MSITDLVDGLIRKAALYSVLATAATLHAQGNNLHALENRVAQTPVIESYASSFAAIDAKNYSCNPVQSYNLQDDKIYVHIPSFVQIHRAPRAVFGPRLYGLANTESGDVFVRDDLEGDAFDEVLDHEIGHVVDPSRSENTNRAIQRAKYGKRGKIHQKLGRANY